MLQTPEPDKEIIQTPTIMRNTRDGANTSPMARRSFEITPFHLHQSAARYAQNNFSLDEVKKWAALANI
ncbi:unnamed protein product [Rotaria magnacalcarata]|uniref:Uncharacterized protein n=2 Tax=Rotaria magnacalcarata TaxID=392030 RepID=A0A8S2MAM8_9BILA|nr:unnamed protein product [Rotaria magnacalcarata]